jgi:hypothetical protein
LKCRPRFVRRDVPRRGKERRVLIAEAEPELDPGFWRQCLDPRGQLTA